MSTTPTEMPRGRAAVLFSSTTVFRAVSGDKLSHTACSHRCDDQHGENECSVFPNIVADIQHMDHNSNVVQTRALAR